MDLTGLRDLVASAIQGTTTSTDVVQVVLAQLTPAQRVQVERAVARVIWERHGPLIVAGLALLTLLAYQAGRRAR